MTPYYHTPERRTALLHAAQSWQGTPFHDHGSIRGAGVDCVNLCGQLYFATGHLTQLKLPAYAVAAGPNQTDCALTKWLEASGRFARCEFMSEPVVHQVGDLLCFRIGKHEHHCGIQISERLFIHALQRAGVIASLVDDPTWAKRLTSIWRPLDH